VGWRVEGFLLNKFRGDASLLEPAPVELEARTGVPTVGVLPFLDHHLPDEEGPTVRTRRPAAARSVKVVVGPYASNLDEFVSLGRVADVEYVADAGTDMHTADLVVIPGSKHVAADLAWLRSTGIADAITAAAGAGVPVLGVCGGLQMLGGEISDPHGVEGAAVGLGLLDVSTSFAPLKRTQGCAAAFPPMDRPWAWLASAKVDGYELHHGVTTAGPGVVPVLRDGLGFGAGNVLGIYLHGVLEDPAVLNAFSGSSPPSLDSVFDRLADAIDVHVDRAWLEARLLGSTTSPPPTPTFRARQP
jgi:adenosylcobyric acid synthase